jgi:hypothetical protein
MIIKKERYEEWVNDLMIELKTRPKWNIEKKNIKEGTLRKAA